ncbi:hypothetical protein K439DRAFT_1618597 [Ramaria rubella]|nr:hypothetical protein K439DRAFT_1618597 [Ramaria rubella]
MSSVQMQALHSTLAAELIISVLHHHTLYAHVEPIPHDEPTFKECLKPASNSVEDLFKETSDSPLAAKYFWAAQNFKENMKKRKVLATGGMGKIRACELKREKLMRGLSAKGISEDVIEEAVDMYISIDMDGS